jgi:hypothetical protein
MATSNSLLAAGFGMQGMASFGAAYSQSQADKAQGAYQRQQYEANQQFAEIQAEDARIRGEKDARLIRGKAQQIKGDQRAALAAQGIDVNSGSAMDLQVETDVMSAQDAMTAKNNAWREAWGYKIQASSYGSQGRFAEMAAQNSSRNTLITGGLSFLSSGMKAAGSISENRSPGSPKIRMTGQSYDRRTMV